MTSLPAIDLGLMAEHLSAHEGVINKLKAYKGTVTNKRLRDIIELQETTMRMHVWIMLGLINPEYNNYIEVPPLNAPFVRHYSEKEGYENTTNNKWIALEAHNTAKNMSNENYKSALMMQDTNVKNAHIEMALQQYQIKEKYAEIIKEMGWEFTPHTSEQEQINTYRNFQHLL
ncbi:hypothetical protein [Alkalibacillus aidingensis]|uniref:hypothetical protein n=1 Tax=Alkalibacillus aidingensis TaxID=2747607 RepID=UPI001660A5C3|nr:hypothetical protein [Alkalibacillus aidingensis]